MKHQEKAFTYKILSSLLAAALLSLSACGSSADVGQSQSDSSTSRPSNKEIPENKGGKNILIAYFAVAENSKVDVVSSSSVLVKNGRGRGYTRVLADDIKNVVGGDLFSIKTSVKYPADGDAVIDQAADEQDAKDRPKLTSHIKNLDKYDTIFIGYPNWWYDMPMVIYSFFDEYDFSGKTIIPFNTHNGSRFSNTIETIQKLEPKANVVTDGFTVNFSDAPNAGKDVAAWLRKLGY